MLRGAAACLIMATLGACGVTQDQSMAVGGFADSAGKLAAGAKAVYAGGANDYAELSQDKYIIPRQGIAERVKAGEFGQSSTGTGLSENNPLALANIQGRLQAADALGAYGTALATLIDAKSQSADFAAAANKFTGALETIPDPALKSAGITKNEISGLGSVLVAAGGFYFDYNRRQTLEDVVPQAAPIIGRLCDMFGHDFDPEQPDSYASVYLQRAEINENGAEAALKANAADLRARAILMPIYSRARSQNERAETLFKPLRAAATSCRKSNDALATAIADPKVSMSDVEDFVKQANAAFVAVQSTVGRK